MKALIGSMSKNLEADRILGPGVDLPPRLVRRSDPRTQDFLVFDQNFLLNEAYEDARLQPIS